MTAVLQKLCEPGAVVGWALLISGFFLMMYKSKKEV